MKVLFHTPAFWPSTGGVEVITETMAAEMINAGVDIVLVSETPLGDAKERNYPYKVVRCPSPMKRIELVQWADVVYSSMASLAMWPYAELLRKPFLWTHNAYQAACIDGLGWEQNQPAPLEPRASFWHHWKVRGPIAALVGGLKLALRRAVAKDLVLLNLPSTRWMQHRLALPHSLQAYTPFPLKQFTPGDGAAVDHTYVYVGRLVSEKGVDVLLRAFKEITENPGHEDDSLLIVGDGPARSDLEAFARESGILDKLTFAGKLHGDALSQAMTRAEIAIVPSTWEEPMGGVTLELLAAGRALIVSERGGPAEIAGEAALTFPNGDSDALVAQMLKLSEDSALRAQLRAVALLRLAEFDEQKLTARYIDIYRAAYAFWNS